jgi:hypothetical protein
MEEFEIGEKITLEIQEVKDISCPSCFFWDEEIGCTKSWVQCFADRRSDGKNVIFKEVKE